MSNIKFEVLGNPQGKGRAKVTTRGAYAHAYTPLKTEMYENLIKMSYINAYGNRPMFTDGQLLLLTVKAYMPIPKSTPQKRIALWRLEQTYCSKKPDMDNIIKVVCDALNGTAYTDDRAVVRLSASKVYSDVPRLEIIVEDLPF